MRVLKYPLATEKAVRLIESDNIVSFVVDPKASKCKIKSEIEIKFNVKVDNVRTIRSPKGVKKAYVKLKQDYPAIDIATRLGLM